jgi:predicted histone-like DNA-binding protein
MAVNYCVFQQKYDMSGKGSNKFYARAQSSGEISFKKLCAKISDRCTATKADVMAALEGCIYVIKDALDDGKIVRLGDFGSFQLGLSSEGADTEKDFSSTNITGAKILFRPGEDLKELFNALEYEKVSANSSTSETTKTTEGTSTETTGA